MIHKNGKTKRINNVGKDVQDFPVKAGVLDSKYVQEKKKNMSRIWPVLSAALTLMRVTITSHQKFC